MKTTADLVKGWMRKADSDLANAALCVNSVQALDTACFHAQQAGEKLLKAYLMAYSLPFPFIHNLEKLVELCAAQDAAFLQIKTLAQNLTPYAVSLRYDEEFWPALQTAQDALDAARAIRAFVVTRMPPAMNIS